MFSKDIDGDGVSHSPLLIFLTTTLICFLLTTKKTESLFISFKSRNEHCNLWVCQYFVPLMCKLSRCINIVPSFVAISAIRLGTYLID